MNPFMPKRFMVMDVESIGLHGEGFAVGWVIMDSKGNIFGDECHACHPERAEGDEVSRRWVSQNCPVPQSGYNHRRPVHVRSTFWDIWVGERAMGTALIADCAWPVEGRFLDACVRDDLQHRLFTGPYPLHELATFLVAANMDPLATYPRIDADLPIHDPLADARHSARLLHLALSRL